jgi:pimeloyl-ACP methyl ester carboxylesterase
MSVLSALRRRSSASLAVLAVAIAALLAAALVPGVAQAADRHRAKPTVVLVHGAFADSSSWNGVVSRLHRDGYPVFAIAIPLRSVDGDATYVADYLKTIEGPIVLVGHSYAGMVITNAVRGNPAVKALVYIEAYAPDKGETATSLSGLFPGSTLGPTLLEVPLTGGGTELILKQNLFWQQFGADLPRSQGFQLAVAQRPILASAFTDPSGKPAWRTVPSYFLIATADRNVPPALQDFMARRAKAKAVRHVQGASHLVLISKADLTAKFIEKAARDSR